MRIRLSAALIAALACAHCDNTGIHTTGDASTDTPSDFHSPGDADGDGISDMDEGSHLGTDTDGDTIPDYLDDDSDGDTIPDDIEGGDYDITTPPVDSDEDGTPDFRDADSDNNGVLDFHEGIMDMDGDTIRDHADPDNDGDAIDDITELQGNPSMPIDSDGDTIPDYRDFDSDNDNISDRHEQDIDTDEDGLPDYLDLDTDGDGLPDALEAGDTDIATPPVDTDGDYIPDFRDWDSDADGLSDEYELEIGTNPYNSDSDMDGCPDLIEVGAGTDPLDAGDNPRTRGNFIFIMYYNDPSYPYDPPIDPDPTMDHIVMTTGSTGPMEVTAVLHDDPSDEVDTVVDFIDYIEPSVVGGWPDPSDPTVICVAGLEVADLHDPFDGRPDSFTEAPADTAVCFDIWVKQNWTVPATYEPQTFMCEIDLVGEGEVVLDTRPVYFLIPPEWPGWP